MSNHGHVIPNLDGFKSSCGGLPRCIECQRELAELDSIRRRAPYTPAVSMRLAIYDLQHARDFAGGPSVIEKQAIEAMLAALSEIEMLKSRIASLEDERSRGSDIPVGPHNQQFLNARG